MKPNNSIIEHLVIFFLLAIFAFYAVNWGVPAIAHVLSERMEKAARIEKVSL